MSPPRPVAAALAGLALLAACAPGARGGSSAAPGASDVTIASRILKPSERDVTPALRGVTLDGDQLNLASLRGHVVVVNYWGSWCAPCRAEAPDLVALAKQTAERGVRFVGVNIRNERANAQAFARRYHIPTPACTTPTRRPPSRSGRWPPAPCPPPTCSTPTAGSPRSPTAASPAALSKQ